MKKYLVIGNPIKHSLSPKLHNHWFKENNIDALYDKEELNESDISRIIDEIKEALPIGFTDKDTKMLMAVTTKNKSEIIDAHPDLDVSNIDSIYSLSYSIITYESSNYYIIIEYSRYEIRNFAKEAYTMGINYLGVCCGANPMLIREVAEAVGIKVPSSKYKENMENHYMFGKNKRIPKHIKEYKNKA